MTIIITIITTMTMTVTINITTHETVRRPTKAIVASTLNDYAKMVAHSVDQKKSTSVATLSSAACIGWTNTRPSYVVTLGSTIVKRAKKGYNQNSMIDRRVIPSKDEDPISSDQ